MKKPISTHLISLILAISILLLFAFTETEVITESVEYNFYNEMMLLNDRVNTEKKAIISTLEHIAYKEWEIDSVTLFLSKYPLMDSVLLKKLHDIEFEFGYSELLERIRSSQSISPISLTDSAIKKRTEDETALLREELRNLNEELYKHRSALDSLRLFYPFKYYLNQPRFYH